MLTTIVVLAEMLAIGFFARTYSRRTRFFMVCGIVIGIVVLVHG